MIVYGAGQSNSQISNFNYASITDVKNSGKVSSSPQKIGQFNFPLMHPYGYANVFLVLSDADIIHCSYSSNDLQYQALDTKLYVTLGNPDVFAHTATYCSATFSSI